MKKGCERVRRVTCFVVILPPPPWCDHTFTPLQNGGVINPLASTKLTPPTETVGLTVWKDEEEEIQTAALFFLTRCLRGERKAAPLLALQVGGKERGKKKKKKLHASRKPPHLVKAERLATHRLGLTVAAVASSVTQFKKNKNKINKSILEREQELANGGRKPRRRVLASHRPTCVCV